MDLTDALKRTRRLVKPFLVTDGKGFRLKDFDPGDTLHYGSEDRPKAKAALAMGVQLLAELQDMLYAQDRWSLLVVFQAMDAAGKDGAIKHVMSGVNPQGCHVTSFKAPSAEELDHDYMWRCYRALPARGQIGIFNKAKVIIAPHGAALANLLWCSEDWTVIECFATGYSPPYYRNLAAFTGMTYASVGDTGQSHWTGVSSDIHIDISELDACMDNLGIS